MNNKILLTLLPLSLLVSGCDSLKHTFGLDHYRADEFKVPNTPPLEMPPDFNLRPPRPGEKNRGDVAVEEKAKEKLGASRLKSDNETEKEFESKLVKGESIDPNIRSKLDQEAKEEESAMERLRNIPKRVKEGITGETDPVSEYRKKNPAETR